jgi:small subunit ribosomal protein S6
MALFGRAKEPSLRQFLSLRHGIPSHDTFSRVFRMLDPAKFHACFLWFMQDFAQAAQGVGLRDRGLTRCLSLPDIRICASQPPSLPGGDGIVPGYARAPRASSQREPIMPLYECVLIARNDVTQQQVDVIADDIAGQLETDGGAVKKREYWGLRSLAYRIKKNRKGHYMLLGLDAKPAFVTEMERQLSLNEDVLRFMTLRVDDIEEAPSAILSRKSDDRERGFRGPRPAGRFDSGRRRGFDDREEFRAREEFREEFRPGAEE